MKRDKDDVAIKSINLDRDTAYCGDSVSMDVKIKNIGTNARNLKQI
jgi:hypothetical protein